MRGGCCSFGYFERACGGELLNDVNFVICHLYAVKSRLFLDLASFPELFAPDPPDPSPLREEFFALERVVQSKGP